MKSTLSLFVILLVFSLTSCSSLKTYTDYDETLDLNQFKEFSFYEDMKTGMDDLDEKRFRAVLEEELIQKGFKKSEHPSFRIYFYSKSYEKKNRHNIGVSIGTFGRHVSGRVGSGIPITSTDHIQTVTVEFADAKTNTLFWQGVSEENMNRATNPQQKRALYQKMVKKLLKKYPPK